jgi:membrane protein DedA with SNARE-associated domain
MSLLDIKKTTLISFAGAFIWNFILIYSGMVFSENWREIYDKLDVYGYVILGLVIIIALFIFFRNKFKKK